MLLKVLSAWPSTAGASESACVEPADCYVMSWTDRILRCLRLLGRSKELLVLEVLLHLTQATCVTGCTDETATNYNADSDHF